MAPSKKKELELDLLLKLTAIYLEKGPIMKSTKSWVHIQRNIDEKRVCILLYGRLMHSL